MSGAEGSRALCWRMLLRWLLLSISAISPPKAQLVDTHSFACELYAHATTYDDLQTQMHAKAAEGVFEPFMDKSWKIAVECVNNHATDKRSLSVINSFGWVGLRGKIDLKKPECEFVILEDCEWSPGYHPIL